MRHQRDQQVARPGDLYAVAPRLLCHGADLSLGLLRSIVEPRCHGRRRLRVFAPPPDELALPLRALGELLRGGGDLLGRRVQLLRRRRDLLCHRGKLLGLPLDPAHDVRDGGGGAIHAHSQEAQLVALPVPD